MSSEIAIDVRSLSKRYEIYATPRDRLKQLVLPRLHRTSRRIALYDKKDIKSPQYFREFWALRDVSFQVRRGETFGIIGRNGSGKSTLLQILAGVLAPTDGDSVATGRVAALLELGSGFDPELTGRENVFLNGRILGLTQREIHDRYDRIVDFADIGEFIDEPVKTYSSGMFLRLAFAVQAHIDAAIVIIDEALAVGDVFFRQKCYARLEQLRAAGTAILLVSHSMPDIEQYCGRALLLDHGKPMFLGTASEAAKHYYLLYQGSGSTTRHAAPTAADVPLEQSELPVLQRPSAEAFISLAGATQVSNGDARCIAVALTDGQGRPSAVFQQGDVAAFFYEFELAGPIGVPICGLIIKNDRGVIVHGKNSWQFEDATPLSPAAGNRVACRQEVVLDLAPGDYVFEVGLAAVSPDEWRSRATTSHETMSALYVSVCQVSRVGVFSVGLKMKDGIPILTHHGIADLPGRIEMAVESN